MKLSIFISLIAVTQAFKMNPEDSKNIQMLSEIQEASLTAKLTEEEKAKNRRRKMKNVATDR